MLRVPDARMEDFSEPPGVPVRGLAVGFGLSVLLWGGIVWAVAQAARM
jgi:hypothetical protein